MRRRVSSANFLGMLTLLGCALTGWAEDELPRAAVLVVPLDHGAAAEVGRIEELAETAVSRSERFELVRLVDALDPAEAKERQAQRAAARRAVDQGTRAYDDLNTQKAYKLFQEAQQAYRRTDLSRTFTELSRAWVLKIAALVANGETKQVGYELEKLLAVDPQVRLDPNYFPPDWLKRADDVRRAFGSSSHRLVVKTEPPGARVYVNGRYRGVSPVTIEGLPREEQLVTAILGGHALAQQVVVPGATRELALRPAERTPAFRSAVAKISANPDGLARDQTAAELGRQLQVDQVVLVVLRKSTVGSKLDAVFVRLAVGDGHNLAYAAAELPAGELLPRAERILITLLGADEPRRDGPVHHVAEASGGRRTVGYVLLGAGAALLGGGLFFGLQANAQHALYRATPQTDVARSSQLRQAGQGHALTADLLMLAAIASALPGGYLAFSSEPPANEAPRSAPSPSAPARGNEDLRDF